jgi:RNA polymerase sigma factor (sigma-70 family)
MHEVGLSARSASPAQIQLARTPDAEIALIERVCSGETQLFYELINPYERRVYVAAVSVLQNEADAEEVAQEAFLKAFVHLHSFRGDAKFSTWLIQIAVNEARRKRRKDHKFLAEGRASHGPAECDCVFESFVSRSVRYARYSESEYCRDCGGPPNQPGFGEDPIASGKIEDTRCTGARTRRGMEHRRRQLEESETLVRWPPSPHRNWRIQL